MILPDIPQDQQTRPWIASFIDLFQKQARMIQEQTGIVQEQASAIQEQARTIQAQAEEIVALKATVQELKDEITRLKKTPKRPKFRQGGTPPNKGGAKPNNPSNPEQAQKAITPKMKEEVTLKPTYVPEGSRFKGYSTYSVQELTLTSKEVTYKLEQWQAPDGSMIRALLPPEVLNSHFGPDLRALIHTLYANGMTQPAIFDFVVSTGIEISEGQIHNILMGEASGYEEHSGEVLSAGLKEAPYIRTDDTGAKHQHQSGYCTHIGGEYFAYYKTTPSKSRINFLKILSQGKEGYFINDAFIWHLFQSGVKDDILNTFELHSGKRYRTKKGLNRLLNQMGLNGKKLRLSCLEAGLVGFIQETLFKPGQVLLSDRAGQFALFDHAGCWVHMERPLRKLAATSPAVEEEIGRVRAAIWSLYAQVKEASLTQTGKEQVKELYDELENLQVTSPGVEAVLKTFREYREELLKALDHPGLPLHNNDSERDIRGMVKFRNISGSTKSEEGRAFRDGLMTLKQTCFRLGKNFWEYLKAWFRREPIDLAQCVRERYQAAAYGCLP